MTRYGRDRDGGATDGALLDRVVARAAALPEAASVVGIALLLAATWAAIHASGGTRGALPHLFYIPIVLAALPFGLPGSVVTAAAAGVLCGPLMPLDVAADQAQATSSWLLRAGMFVVVGAATGAVRTVRDRVHDQRLEAELQPTPPHAVAGAAEPELVARVRDVLASGAFHIVFQPIYDLRDGRLLAVEALTRVDAEPYRTPDKWFAAAQEAGCGIELEIAAIEAAVHAAVDLPRDVSVAVNASPTTLTDPRLLEVVGRCRRRDLVVEITEHAVVEDYENLTAWIRPLRDAGLLIAVDDAGAGIASMLHIVELGPDIIKLDMSLTQDVGTSPLRRALAGSLIEFADRTGARLVVEGIESAADLAVWADLGAHAAQGYLLGRPAALPAARTSAVVQAMAPAR